MKIIYTEKKEKNELSKKLRASFECLGLVLVMCVFGITWGVNKLEKIESTYDTVPADNVNLDAVELEIPARSDLNRLEAEYIECAGEMSVFEEIFKEKQEALWTK